MTRNRLIAAAMCVAAGGSTLALTACRPATTARTRGRRQADHLMFRGGPDEKAAYEAAIAKYTADTGVKVKVIVTDADQYATKLQAAVAGNNVPDVFYIEQASLQSYVSSGVLMDITEGGGMPAASTSTTSGPTAWTPTGSTGTLQGTPDGKLYGLPKDVGPFSFGYNKTMLEAAGIPLPDKDTPLTWDQFVDIGKQLTTDTDGDGAVDQWGTGLNVQWNLQSMVWEQRRRLDQRGPHRGHRRHPRVRRGAAEVRGPHERRQGDGRPPPTPPRWTPTSAGWPARSASSRSDRGTSRSTTASTSTHDLIPWPTVGDVRHGHGGSARSASVSPRTSKYPTTRSSSSRT